ncbi:MAG: response regulator [Flavitalea sp.]
MPVPPYVLLIDDDTDDLEMLSEALQGKGIRTSSFESGKQAVLYLNKLSEINDLPGMIIMDYNMPENNGQEILILLKKELVTRNIPVIMYSTGLSVASSKQLEELGALHCFAKSSNYPDFTLQLEKFTRLAYSFPGNHSSVLAELMVAPLHRN